MKIYIIKQKMSGTGSIRDIASQHYERKIKFRRGERYAVVLAAYYGDHYTTHRTPKAAAVQSIALADYVHTIIDSDGNVYTTMPVGPNKYDVTLVAV